jgi:hypothetical protein
VINSEQQRYWEDPRVYIQEEQYKSAILSKPPSYYSKLSCVGIDVREGQAAKASVNVREADFLFGNCKALDRWLENGTGDKLFLLRDPKWLDKRPKIYGSTFLRNLQANGIKSLEVQHLGKRLKPGENSAEILEMDEVIKSFEDPNQSKRPKNLLNLMGCGYSAFAASARTFDDAISIVQRIACFRRRE